MASEPHPALVQAASARAFLFLFAVCWAKLNADIKAIAKTTTIFFIEAVPPAEFGLMSYSRRPKLTRLRGECCFLNYS
jgi:hypothetical protein